MVQATALLFMALLSTDFRIQATDELFPQAIFSLQLENKTSATA